MMFLCLLIQMHWNYGILTSKKPLSRSIQAITTNRHFHFCKADYVSLDVVVRLTNEL